MKESKNSRRKTDWSDSHVVIF